MNGCEALILGLQFYFEDTAITAYSDLSNFFFKNLLSLYFVESKTQTFTNLCNYNKFKGTTTHSNKIKSVIFWIHTLRVHLQACCSQSEFRIRIIRESSVCALFLYNCTQNTSCSVDASMGVTQGWFIFYTGNLIFFGNNLMTFCLCCVWIRVTTAYLGGYHFLPNRGGHEKSWGVTEFFHEK